MIPFKRIFAVIFVFLFVFSCTEDVPISPLTQTSQGLGSETFATDAEEGSRAVVKVMTYNIYVGANVDSVLAATDPVDLALKVAAAYDTVYFTKFWERAQSISKLIKKHRPHLIGIQEASLIQLINPANGMVEEELDYLQILMNELDAQNLNYQVAESIQNFDQMLPRYLSFTPPSTLEYDLVRLVDSDVILVRNDVQYSNPIKGNYAAFLSVPVPTNPPSSIDIPRGYVSVEAKVGKKSYRFINTHLEAFTELYRLPQAQELCAIFAGETLPIIMVGDFNTLDPEYPNPYADTTYNYITKSGGFTDTWVHNLKGNQGAGYTSPFSAALLDPYPDLYQRIDLIFAKNFQAPIGPVQAEVIGTSFKDRTPSGLWPSDHASVVAQLHLREMSILVQNELVSAEVQE